MELRVEKRIYSRAVDFYLLDRAGRSIGTSVVMEKMEEGVAWPPPTFELAESNAQQLMDELWHCGFRPSEGSGSAGSLAATERHLQDMRALVFKEEGLWRKK